MCGMSVKRPFITFCSKGLRVYTTSFSLVPTCCFPMPAKRKRNQTWPDCENLNKREQEGGLALSSYPREKGSSSGGEGDGNGSKAQGPSRAAVKSDTRPSRASGKSSSTGRACCFCGSFFFGRRRKKTWRAEKLVPHPTHPHINPPVHHGTLCFHPPASFHA